MPLYEYQCDECGHRFERLQKFSDEPVKTCTVCGGRVQKLVSSSAIQFKGTGWYVTDYARKPSGDQPPGDAEKAEGKESKASEGTGAKEGPKKESTSDSSSSSASSPSTSSEPKKGTSSSSG